MRASLLAPGEKNNEFEMFLQYRKEKEERNKGVNIDDDVNEFELYLRYRQEKKGIAHDEFCDCVGCFREYLKQPKQILEVLWLRKARSLGTGRVHRGEELEDSYECFQEWKKFSDDEKYAVEECQECLREEEEKYFQYRA